MKKRNATQVLGAAALLLILAGFLATCGDMDVFRPPLDRIQLDRGTLILEKGQRQTLRAAMVPSNAESVSITWESNDTNVADVFNGVVNAKKPGTAIITASHSNKTLYVYDTCIVTVVEINLDKQELYLKEKDEYPLNIRIDDGSGSTKGKVTWTTDNDKAVLFVNSDGTTGKTSTGTTARVIGMSKGSATITAVVTIGTEERFSFRCDVTVGDEGTAITPTAHPPEGFVSIDTPVILYSETNGAAIHYTMDGTNPTENSPVYDNSAPIRIIETSTNTIIIKAIAIKAGMKNSGIMTVVYTTPPRPKVDTPIAEPRNGAKVQNNTSIALTTLTLNTAIYYTLDGSNPTTGSTLYAIDNQPIIKEGSTTLKAFAVDLGGVLLNSDILVAAYIIDNAPLTPVNFTSVTADGDATRTTTALTLNFSAAIAGLEAKDITLTGVPGVITGTLSTGTPASSGSGMAYTLPISGFTSTGTLSVDVKKQGFDITGTPKTVEIHYAPISVTLNSVKADGDANTTTTELTLHFSDLIKNLAANDITLTGVPGATSTGTAVLSTGTPTSGSVAAYILPISGFSTSGTLGVDVKKHGYIISGTPSVDIYYAPPTVNFISVEANGSTGTSTALTLNFSAAIAGLEAKDITFSGTPTGVLPAATGVLSPVTGTGTAYILPITNVTSTGTLLVHVNPPGYTISGTPQSTPIYYVAPPVNLISVTANGTASQITTTNLTLHFSALINSLAPSNINLSGSPTGLITGTGTSLTLITGTSAPTSGAAYSLPIDVSTSGTVSVAAVTIQNLTITGTPSSGTAVHFAKVILSSGSDPGFIPGDKKITGLTGTKNYIVQVGTGTGTSTMYVTSTGTLTNDLMNIGKPTGGEITSLDVGKTYKVNAETQLTGTQMNIFFHKKSTGTEEEWVVNTGTMTLTGNPISTGTLTIDANDNLSVYGVDLNPILGSNVANKYAITRVLSTDYLYSGTPSGDPMMEKWIASRTSAKNTGSAGAWVEDIKGKEIGIYQYTTGTTGTSQSLVYVPKNKSTVDYMIADITANRLISFKVLVTETTKTLNIIRHSSTGSGDWTTGTGIMKNWVLGLVPDTSLIVYGVDLQPILGTGTNFAITREIPGYDYNNNGGMMDDWNGTSRISAVRDDGGTTWKDNDGSAITDENTIGIFQYKDSTGAVKSSIVYVPTKGDYTVHYMIHNKNTGLKMYLSVEIKDPPSTGPSPPKRR